MINAQFFYDQLRSRGTGFFTGVPDSLLKSFCALLTDRVDKNLHVIAVNEGAAVAMAAGYHLATGKTPLVYMQNSGIGNAVNPLLSLADGDVYRVPMVLLVGWRGEPGVKDEPQHVKQGMVTCELLDTMGIPYLILGDDEDEVGRQLDECYRRINKEGTPFALVVRKDVFSFYGDGGEPPVTPPPKTDYPKTHNLKQSYAVLSEITDLIKSKPDTSDAMTREEAIEVIVKASSDRDIFVSTTGMASRELYELRDKYGMGHERDFLTVGSMGHASSIALAIAMQKIDRTVICIDGDGAALMHMGAMATIGTSGASNLLHIVLNNGAHDSVGGQPTIAEQINLVSIAAACGYGSVYNVDTADELRRVLDGINNGIDNDNIYGGPFFIEISVRKGNRKDLGRPKSSPQENKDAFMQFIAKDIS